MCQFGKLILQSTSSFLLSKFNYNVVYVDMKEYVAPESNRTLKGLKFKKRVPITIVSEFDDAFLLIT